MSINKFVIPLAINFTILFLLFCQHLILESPIFKLDKSGEEKQLTLEKLSQQPVLEILEIEPSKLKVSEMDFPSVPSLNAPLKHDKVETFYENPPSEMSSNSFARKTPKKHKLNTLKMEKYSSELIPMKAQRLRKEQDFESIVLLKGALEPKVAEVMYRKKLKSVLKPMPTKTKYIMPRLEDTKENVPEVSIEKADLLHGISVLAAVEKERNLNMEIFWPNDTEQAQFLFNILEKCFGMRNAVLDQNGQIYDELGRIRTETQKISPFLRQIEETISATEDQNILKILHNNNINGDQIFLRVVSFKTDAKIMDGISKLYGDDLMQTNSIRAEYTLVRADVYIDEIIIDGKKIKGRIKLTGRKCAI